MAFIYETENFIVEAFDKPHVTRLDGGHIKIMPKIKVLDRSELSPKLAIELMRLTMIIGKAFKIAMTNRGVEIMRVNYHDMDNWAYKKDEKPYFHIHLYGRAKNAKFQPYYEAVQLPDRNTGFYDNFEPLYEDDVKEIQKQINIILKERNYSNKEWGL
ncbi:MAG: hypothetical protein PHZ07_03325 [Patescibacteria group bacterium]|nr:hypothetical protein [Patescibacteria group bacterium]MDD4304349.1 hypothetical protein [Patescibacteria group bacterium]MDD4695372.1 hypothetical protein [Patescibacteria group bacterium]